MMCDSLLCWWYINVPAVILVKPLQVATSLRAETVPDLTGSSLQLFLHKQVKTPHLGCPKELTHRHSLTNFKLFWKKQPLISPPTYSDKAALASLVIHKCKIKDKRTSSTQENQQHIHRLIYSTYVPTESPLVSEIIHNIQELAAHSSIFVLHNEEKRTIKCHYPNKRSHNRLCAWGWMLFILSGWLRIR